MQALQKEAADKGVVWLSICSSAPGKQGHFDIATWRARAAQAGNVAAAILPDADGAVGRRYGAKTTPHLFVIAADGTMAYQGAIDDRPNFDPATIPGARNYVREAMQALLAGGAVTVPSTKPYGCSVKY